MSALLDCANGFAKRMDSLSWATHVVFQLTFSVKLDIVIIFLTENIYLFIAKRNARSAKTDEPAIRTI